MTLVLGVNDDAYDKDKHDVVSNASCTTNCLGPVARVLARRGRDRVRDHDHDPRLHGRPAASRTRRTRTCAARAPRRSTSCPTSTGAAKAIGLVMPELDGKLNGIAVRAPCPRLGGGPRVPRLPGRDRRGGQRGGRRDGRQRARSRGSSSTPRTRSSRATSSRSPYSSIFDSKLTMVMDDRLVKVVAWYDNEWGYSNRVVDLAERVLAGVGTRSVTRRP